MNPATASSMLVLVFSLVIIAAGAESLEKSSFNSSLIEELVPVVETKMEFRDISGVFGRRPLGHYPRCLICTCCNKADPKRCLKYMCCHHLKCGLISCTWKPVACNCDNCN
nr:kinase APK1B, chloroplast precursor [Ipomoea batatas]